MKTTILALANIQLDRKKKKNLMKEHKNDGVHIRLANLRGVKNLLYTMTVTVYIFFYQAINYV